MGKLNSIVFQSTMLKDFEVQGHKVKLRALTTKDTIDLNISADDKLENTTDILKFAMKVLSRSILEVDSIVPDGEQDVLEFLNAQTPVTVLELLNCYQQILTVTSDDLKNSEGTPS